MGAFVTPEVRGLILPTHGTELDPSVTATAVEYYLSASFQEVIYPCCSVMKFPWETVGNITLQRVTNW